jgi:hypothetical protein
MIEFHIHVQFILIIDCFHSLPFLDVRIPRQHSGPEFRICLFDGIIDKNLQYVEAKVINSINFPYSMVKDSTTYVVESLGLMSNLDLPASSC